ncbi:hypothetical protein KTR66_02990 [Roseococcus sp. SDR]|uniref:glycosyl hydrolase family 28-related protein n=1 Tax=Roseococcus sp. SDR TaxID=2835532 RepID=UPI001BCF6B4D|nr:glycosyl hydrolase family 28-related protein [Roseococcus sp. SDR]MBS7788943.1 hypothetical protein [Roseococcus sp. SDR]MBV1844257.1 hypothetical protein [Roseococcus sp. SDR]
MPDLKISELPAATAVADGDLTPFVQTSPTAATRRATLSQMRRAVLADRGVDVRDFGAVGNGTTNDAPAIQAAINALGTAGGVVQFGPRTYRIASAITINNGAVRLQGAGFSEGGSPGQGTWLTVDLTGFTPFTFTGVGARGSAVCDMAFRQNHTAALNASWAPTNYDWLFRVTDCFGGVDFDNIMLSGINRGIFVRNSGRTDFRRIRGQVFTAGIEIDEGYDTSRILNMHLWPFWSADDNVVRWQQANGDAMIFRRCDGVFVDQSFVLGYRSMFRFTSSAAGYTQKFSIGQAYADFVRHGLWVEAAGTDGQVDAMTVQCEIFNAGGAPLPGSIGVYVNTNLSRVQIASLRIDDAEDNPIRIEGAGNRVDIGALRCVNFNLRNNGAAAIHLANVASGTPNRVNLGSPPLLETANPGPVFNAASNGSVGMQAPAGEAARPGLSLAQYDTGLFLPSAGSLGVSVAGGEIARLAAGSTSLGGATGAHGLEVTTPASAVNRPEMVGAVTGTPARTGWRAKGADANISAIMQPKGTGALIAQFPDNAASGGNARGANSVDWQTARTLATQVSSGANATISGGQNNLASGANTTIGGGSTNTASGNNAAIGGGANNTVSSSHGVVAGGTNNTVSSGTQPSIGGGNGNTASGNRATVAGGLTNTASGANSWVPGGANASTRGIAGRGAWAGGQIAALGDAQSGEHVLFRQTTDATATRLTGDNAAPGAANQIVLPNFAAYSGTLTVIAKAAGSTAAATWRVNVSAVRGNGVATIVLYEGAGTALVPNASSGAGSAWRLDIAADTTNGAIGVTVTGAAATTITHTARFANVEATTAS